MGKLFKIKGINTNGTGVRMCKACRQYIEIGTLCISYSKGGKKHRTYHCLSCARRYNPTEVTKTKILQAMRA